MEQLGMNEQDIETLKSNRINLSDNIADPDSVNEFLFVRDVFTEAMKEEVEAEPTNTKKIWKILDLIPKRGREAFDKFYQILIDTKNDDAAAFLRPTPTAEELPLGTTEDKTEKIELRSIPLLPEGKVYHVFFVYRTVSPDKDWVINVVKRLENEGFKCGFHERDFMPGEKILSNIEDSFRKSLKVILALSPDFLQSEWTIDETELAKGLSLEKSAARLSLIPVLLRPCKVPACLQTLTYLDVQEEENKWWPRLKKAITNIPDCQDEQINDVVETQISFPKNWPDEKAMTEEIKVIPCSRSSMVFMQNWNSPVTYSMKKKIRGRAVIICNEHFDDRFLCERYGTEHDRNRLKELFKQLHFEVTVHDDLKEQDIRMVLSREICDPYHKTVDCFILVILSHEDEHGGVYGTDGRVVSLKEITESFAPESCPNLANKPKIFFFLMQQGVVSRAKDMLIAFSSYEGFYSMRNTKYGTWFIQAVIWVFQRYSHQEELSSLLKRVNHLLSKGKVMNPLLDVCKSGQASCYSDHLTKTFYFFPGCYE